MVKLCRTCGYINRDDALECEECHSLFDDKINSLVTNEGETNNSISIEENEYQPSEIISLSDLLKMNNEDVVSDQKQFIPDIVTNTDKISNTTNEELFNNYNKEDNELQYVSEFLYSKNGESEDFVIDENQFIGNPKQKNEYEQMENDSNDISDFLYKTVQDNDTSNPINSLNIDNDFEQTSVTDFLYENTQIIDNNDASNDIELNDDFDAETNVTDILYNNYNNNNTNVIVDNNVINNNLVNDKPFDIIYDNQSKDISNFLYNEENFNNNDNQVSNNDVDNMTSISENNVLEEISIDPQDISNINNVYQPADVEDLYVPYDEQIPDYNDNETDKKDVYIDENVDNSTEIEEEFSSNDELSFDDNQNNEEDTIENTTDLDSLSEDNTNIKEFDTLSDDIIEGSGFANETINDSAVNLPNNCIDEVVDNELKDETYMQNLDISNILSYGNDEEIVSNIVDEQDNTQNTKTGLLDTLKQIFSFSSSSSKELSKEEIEKEYNNEEENDAIQNTINTNISLKEIDESVNDKEPGPLENFNSNIDSSSKPKATGFTNIKPMEIRRKSVENINKATNTSEDNDLADAFKVFESAGSYKKEEDSPKTVVYDFPNNGSTKDKNNANETAIPNKDIKNDSKKSKLFANKKQKMQKPISKKNTILKRSIALSIAVASIIIAIVVISRINKEKELKAYATRIAANNDISYTYLYNCLLEKGYSEDESFKTIESLNIDFAENALNVLYSIAEDSNKLSSKEEARKVLEGKGFANSEIEKAMTLADWSKYLNTYINACIAKTKELDKAAIIKTIESAGFTSIEIDYVKKNSDWTKLAKKNLDSYLNNDEGVLHTKEEARLYLIEKGYSDQDIDNLFKNYEWDVYAYQYLTKYLQQKEEEGIAIESSRISYTKILEDAKFDEEDIELVMGRFDFASYAKSKIDTTINEGSDFVNKNKVKESLEKEGYTEEEIESALKETDWNATAIASLKSLDNRKLSKKEMIQKLTDAGYSEEEINYVSKNYDWKDQGYKYTEFLNSENKNGNEEHLRSILTDSGYSSDDIDKILYSLPLDYFTAAAKEDIKDISSSSDFSRKKAKKYLNELYYGDKEINSVINSLDWEDIASTFIKSININSRAEARKALQSDDFTSKEIEIAISSISSSSWAQLCNDYSKVIYNQESDDDKCEDYKKYRRKEETSIEKALKNVEYSDNEISNALEKLFINNAPCVVE